MKPYKYLIVGGGMAADAAVKGIRKVDAAGPIGVLCAELDPPYKRPPLTKDLWTKGKPIEKIDCRTAARGAEILGARRAVSLDPARHEVVDEQGEIYRFERLLLATGGTPKRLPFGGDLVMYYRTLADYRRLRTLTEPARHFAVLGGSFIGSELAAALTVNRQKVTLVFPGTGIAGRMLPRELSRVLTQYYEDRGVTVLAGHKPTGIDSSGGRCTLQFEKGTALSVDAVVAGIGITPNTELAAKAGLDVTDGIVVDERLRTKHRDIFAAGDVANFYSPALGQRLRVEHEDNALRMGETAGRNMAGEEQPYHHLPFFYSDLFDVGYEAVGRTDSSLEVVTELRDLTGKGILFYLQDGRVRGVVFWNLFGKVDAGRELIAAPGPHTKDGLKAWARERLEP